MKICPTKARVFAISAQKNPKITYKDRSLAYKITFVATAILVTPCILFQKSVQALHDGLRSINTKLHHALHQIAMSVRAIFLKVFSWIIPEPVKDASKKVIVCINTGFLKSVQMVDQNVVKPFTLAVKTIHTNISSIARDVQLSLLEVIHKCGERLSLVSKVQ